MIAKLMAMGFKPLFVDYPAMIGEMNYLESEVGAYAPTPAHVTAPDVKRCDPDQWIGLYSLDSAREEIIEIAASRQKVIGHLSRCQICIRAAGECRCERRTLLRRLAPNYEIALTNATPIKIGWSDRVKPGCVRQGGNAFREARRAAAGTDGTVLSLFAWKPDAPLCDRRYVKNRLAGWGLSVRNHVTVRLARAIADVEESMTVERRHYDIALTLQEPLRGLI